MTKNDPKSLMKLVLSMAIFGSVGLFRRAVPLSSEALACFRGVSGAALLYAYARLRGKWPRERIGSRRVIRLCAAGAMMGFNWILLFEAYNYTTVPTATLCYYMQPTIVMLLSPAVFGDRMTARKALCVILALAGMVLVSGAAGNGAPGPDEIRGILYGLGAAALYAGVVISNKTLPGLDAYRKTVIQLLASAAAVLPYLLARPQTLPAEWTPGTTLALAAVALVHTCAAYALYFGSMDALRTETVAMFSYLDPVAALILSAALLGEKMTAPGILGAVLILGAAWLGETRLKKDG